MAGTKTADLRIDLYKHLLENWGNIVEKSETDLFENGLAVEPDLSGSRFSATVYWMKRNGQIEEVRPNVFRLIERTDKRVTDPSVLKAGRNRSALNGVSATKVSLRVDHAPTTAPAPVQSNPADQHRDVAPFFQNSSGHVIRISRDDTEIENVVHCALIFRNGQRFELPLMTEEIRMRTSPNRPRWSANQSTNENVIKVELTQLDGRVLEIPLNPDFLLTIDSE